MQPVDGIGVPQLERILCPIPPRSSLLITNEPGLEAEPFLYQAAHHHLVQGGKVVYAVTNRSPESVLGSMHAFGLDVHEHRERLHFLDGFSAMMGMPSQARYVVDRPAEPARFAEVLATAAGDHPDAWLIVDSLSSLLDQSDADAWLRAYPRIQEAIRRFAFAEVLFTRWPYPPEVDAALTSFDGHVSVRAVEERVTISPYFRVERASWQEAPDTKPRLYRSLKPGGVHVYIPKIVVTGPYNAGKSSFVQSISDTAVSVDHLGTTVALDHGRATLDGLTADIFGTPGQARFDPLLKIVAGQALGVIVVVDSTKPDSFPRAKEMLHAVWNKGIPGIIAANKQDLPDALDASEVARLLAPPPTVKVVGCSGQDRESGRRVLKELLDMILTPQEVPA